METGWMGGWVVGWESGFKDCLQQSKNMQNITKNMQKWVKNNGKAFKNYITMGAMLWYILTIFYDAKSKQLLKFAQIRWEITKRMSNIFLKFGFETLICSSLFKSDV